MKHLQYYKVTSKIVFLDTIYLRLIFPFAKIALIFSRRQSISRQQQWYCLEIKAKFCCLFCFYFWKLEGKGDLCKTSSLSKKYNFKLHVSKLCKFVSVLFCFVFCFGCLGVFFSLLFRKLIVNFWAKFCSFWKETGVISFHVMLADMQKNTFCFEGEWCERKGRREGEVHLQK